MTLTADSRTFRAAVALLFALLSLAIVVGNASAMHKRHHKHHHHHRRHHVHRLPPTIGPGGDGDGDNNGAPSDGDGGI